MPRKRSVREEAEASRPRQLRKRLRKAEDQLADAQQKRDRAQARVEALNIIADEIRAQLAEADKAVELEGVVEQEAEQKPPAARKRAAARSDKAEASAAAASATVDKPTTTKKPAAATKKPVAATKKPVAATKKPVAATKPSVE
jgi:hypothetical protein